MSARSTTKKIAKRRKKKIGRGVDAILGKAKSGKYGKKGDAMLASFKKKTKRAKKAKKASRNR